MTHSDDARARLDRISEDAYEAHMKATANTEPWRARRAGVDALIAALATAPAAETAGIGKRCAECNCNNGECNWIVATPADTSASVVGDREAIARIINPQAFDENYRMTGRMCEQKFAFERADTILAALASQGKADK